MGHAIYDPGQEDRPDTFVPPMLLISPAIPDRC